jgi:membrane-bound ClpP family serine protease
MTTDRGKRPGSRLLLGIALFAGILASICGGALLADFALDLLGVSSSPVRLGAKVIAMVAALPAGFYLVERAFLARSSATRKTPGP